MRTLFVICFVSALASVAVADDTPVRQVKARSLALTVPADWKNVETVSKMRVAQFSLPNTGETASDLVVFYFGGPTGGVKANVDRWVGQFAQEDRKVDMVQGKCTAGSYILVDAVGTWNKPDGSPFAQKKIATPGSRVVNVIVIEKQDDAEDYYFLKLSGLKAGVANHVDALRLAIGVDPESEKPFDLKDAPN